MKTDTDQMKNTHTPDPWHACDNGDKTYHIAPDSAFVGGKRWYQDKVATGIQSEADARLIAAAPDLLAALEKGIEVAQEALEYAEQTDDGASGLMSRLRQFIANEALAQTK